MNRQTKRKIEALDFEINRIEVERGRLKHRLRNETRVNTYSQSKTPLNKQQVEKNSTKLNALTRKLIRYKGTLYNTLLEVTKSRGAFVSTSKSPSKQGGYRRTRKDKRREA